MSVRGNFSKTPRERKSISILHYYNAVNKVLMGRRDKSKAGCDLKHRPRELRSNCGNLGCENHIIIFEKCLIILLTPMKNIELSRYFTCCSGWTISIIVMLPSRYTLTYLWMVFVLELENFFTLDYKLYFFTRKPLKPNLMGILLQLID